MSKSGHYLGGGTVWHFGPTFTLKRRKKKRTNPSGSASAEDTSGSNPGVKAEKEVPRRTQQAAITQRSGGTVDRGHNQKPPRSARTSADYRRALSILKGIAEGRLTDSARTKLDSLLGGIPKRTDVPIWLDHLEKNPVKDPIKSQPVIVKARPARSVPRRKAPASKVSSGPVPGSVPPDDWKTLGEAALKRLLVLLSNRSNMDFRTSTQKELTRLAGQYPTQEEARDWLIVITGSHKQQPATAATLARIAQLKQAHAQLLDQAARARQQAEKAENAAKALEEEIVRLEG